MLTLSTPNYEKGNLGKFTSHHSPIRDSELIDSLEESTQRSLRPFSFLPSIKVNSKKADGLLFDQLELQESLNTKINKDDLNQSMDVYRKQRINMSMIFSGTSKLTSALPSNRGAEKDKLLGMSKRRSEIGHRLRSSFAASNSVASDRLIDYINMKNTRMNNMSMHEQFNLDILNNPTSWGEHTAGRNERSNNKSMKYSSNMQKHSMYPDTLVTKRRVLNHKRKDFWNLSLSNKQSLPPPPMGRSYGHGILANKLFKGARISIDARDLKKEL
jgi:hypothetical protein